MGNINTRIFREYDIRGVADRDMPDALVYHLGLALGTYVTRRGGQRFVVSRDCRLSSDRLHTSLVKGLLETGLELLDIGIGPTPLMYFAVWNHEASDGGVQITGSHNPPDENGFKIMCGRDTLYGPAIQELRDLIEREDYDRKPGGKRSSLEIIPAYLGFVRGNIHLGQRLPRFAVDAGNGAGGPLAIAVMREMGLAPIDLLCTMDGHFPVHHPDPSQPENLELLRQTVAKEKVDFGIAYDGDADRIGVIDAQGNVLWGDRLVALFARDILSRRPGAAVIGEVKCSQVMYDDIKKHGGRPIVWKTGHSLIKKKIKEEGALLAGEMSGHIFFADRFYGFDDAIYASMRLVELFSHRSDPLHAMLADLPVVFSTPELRVDCSDDLKFQVVEQVLSYYRGKQPVVDIDGARVTFDDGWGLVRASNTQPALVLRFEASSQARCDQIRLEMEKIVHQAMAHD